MTLIGRVKRMYGRTVVLSTVIGSLMLAAGTVHVAGADQKRGGKQSREKVVATSRPESGLRGDIGPDIIVGQVGSDPITQFGSFNNYPVWEGWQPYAVNTTACNIGDDAASWRDGTTEAPDARHPVIAQNMYRLKDGRFEQIGLSWLKHGVCALAGELCGDCTHQQDCNWLFAGCADAYSAGQNGNFQNKLTPRSEVNPATGVFPFPSPTAEPIANSSSRRLRALQTDVQAALNPGALYFFEAQYISKDEINAGNGLNNVSYRQIDLDDNGLIEGAPSATVQMAPALLAWQAADPEVDVQVIDVKGDGRLYLAWRVTNVSGGSWDYEYAIYNMNSHRGVGEFRVPVPNSAKLCQFGFHDVQYDAGEPYDGTDWPTIATAGWFGWATTDYVNNPNANAIRWGTLYNFRFRTDAPPVAANVEIELFRPGAEAFVSVQAVGPDVNAIFCAADCEPLCGDGQVTIADIIQVLTDFDLPDSPCDVAPDGGDGVISVADITEVMAAFGTCNP
jgi:hypothetical protein